MNAMVSSRTLVAALLCLTAMAAPVSARQSTGAPQNPSTAPAGSQAAKPADSYDQLYQRYLQAARAVDSRGSGASISWMSSLMGDSRARNVNDLVTVRVIENISGAGTADSSLAKEGTGKAAVTKMFGVESLLPVKVDPTNLVGLGTNTNFAGSGTTTRSGALTAVLTARVAEVLPNGDLVLEGAREIDINGDRQMVVLTGVVRPSDLTANNTVLSTQVGQLGIRYFGRGLMKDNLKPGWLIRVINMIF
jgi:flagellar L-ring protein FlgH